MTQVSIKLFHASGLVKHFTFHHMITQLHSCHSNSKWSKETIKTPLLSPEGNFDQRSSCCCYFLQKIFSYHLYIWSSDSHEIHMNDECYL